MNTFLTLLTALVLGASSALAQQSFDLDDIAKVDLIRGWQTDDGNHQGAVRITLAKGWKTYWRVGGENGLPPSFDWQRSENLAGVSIFWPRPEILTTDGVRIVGYKNQLILPIEFSPETEGEEISIDLVLRLGVCQEVCVPVQIPLKGTFGAEPGDDRFLIELALANGVTNGDEAGFSAHNCNLTPIEDGYLLSAQISQTANFSPEYVMVETATDEVWVAPTSFTQKSTEIHAKTSMLSYGSDAIEIDTDNLRITLISADQAVEIIGCPTG